MQEDNNARTYFYVITKKLILLGILVLFLNILALFVVNRFFFEMEFSVPLFAAFFPVVLFLGFWLYAWLTRSTIMKLTEYIYNPYIPFLLRHKPNPVKNPTIDIALLQQMAQPCDIILRRYNQYLDSIIFSENSYFTHVGLCYGEGDVVTHVWHSTGKHGVHKVSLEEFCCCDEVAVIRFGFGKTEEEERLLHHLQHGMSTEVDGELGIVEHLLKKIKTEIPESSLTDEDNFDARYKEVILRNAVALEGTPYDYKFDFKNAQTMSCVEYVWYCYKCLFPLHRIKVRDFEFFEWVKLPVIIPDVFVRNDYFDYVCSSLPGISGKQGLIEAIDGRKRKFWKFLTSIFVWNVVILAAIYFLKDYLSDQ